MCDTLTPASQAGMPCRFVQVPVHVAQTAVWQQSESGATPLGEIAADLGVHVIGSSPLASGALLLSQRLSAALEDVAQLTSVSGTAAKLTQVWRGG